MLDKAGYRTIKTYNITSAIRRASEYHLAIIGHTFEPTDQESFVEQVHKTYPSLFVICLRYGMIHPQTLLTAVETAFAAQPGGTRFWVIEMSEIASWPERVKAESASEQGQSATLRDTAKREVSEPAPTTS